MLTQTELYSNGEFFIFWLQHNPFEGEVLKVGQCIGLSVDPARVWIVGQVWMSLGDDHALLPTARKTTVISYLEEDGSAELSTVYPRISVV